MKRLIDWFFFPTDSAPRATVLIRVMAGAVFFWEGILKFVYTNQGVGRFTKLGIPFPGPTAHFVAVLEIVGGLLLISGFLTRVIAVPFVIEMIVAVLTPRWSGSAQRHAASTAPPRGSSIAVRAFLRGIARSRCGIHGCRQHRYVPDGVT